MRRLHSVAAGPTVNSGQMQALTILAASLWLIATSRNFPSTTAAGMRSQSTPFPCSAHTGLGVRLFDSTTRGAPFPRCTNCFWSDSPHYLPLQLFPRADKVSSSNVSAAAQQAHSHSQSDLLQHSANQMALALGFARPVPHTAHAQFTSNAFQITPELIMDIDQANSLVMVMSGVVRSGIFCSGKFRQCL